MEEVLILIKKLIVLVGAFATEKISADELEEELEKLESDEFTPAFLGDILGEAGVLHHFDDGTGYARDFEWWRRTYEKLQNVSVKTKKGTDSKITIIKYGNEEAIYIERKEGVLYLIELYGDTLYITKTIKGTGKIDSIYVKMDKAMFEEIKKLFT